MAARPAFDCASQNRWIETINKESRAKEQWFKDNREQIWNENMGPICCRYQQICKTNQELARQLMDSQDEYFKFVKAAPWKWPQPPACSEAGNPYPAPFTCYNEQAVSTRTCCDECCEDPTKPMKCVPECQKAILFEGTSAEGKGYKGYLKNRWDSGLPEYRFCRPPTTNSEYAWRMSEHLQCMKKGAYPSLDLIGKDFFRNRGAITTPDCAPFHFP